MGKVVSQWPHGPSVAITVPGSTRQRTTWTYADRRVRTGISCTQTFLQELADQYDSQDDLDLISVAKRVRELLSPGYQEMQWNVFVAIALVKNGLAEVGLQIISDQPKLIEGHQLPQVIPNKYLHQPDLDFLHDPMVTDPDEVQQRAQQLIEKYMACDAALPPQNRSIGGPIDLVLLSDRAYAKTIA